MWIINLNFKLTLVSIEIIQKESFIYQCIAMHTLLYTKDYLTSNSSTI